MNGPFRRFVTGHDAAGRSVFLNDFAAPNVHSRGAGAVRVTEMWESASTPADNHGDADPTAHAFRLPPPANGSVFRVIEYPPDSQRLPALARDHAGTDQSFYKGQSRHPGFHKTDSLDYAIVLSGEIWALMDEGEVCLNAGDCLIQRGTNHAWSNRTEATAVVAFVLIDAKQ